MDVKKIKHFTFDYNKKLGEGATGTVYLGTDLRSNTPVAVKAIELKNIDNEVTQYLLKNEIKALKTTNHPNVLKAIDVIQEPEFVYIITDYLPNGTLAQYIDRKGFIPEREALQIFKQIVDGYDHIFDLHIFHRDLKPHNILFDARFQPVLSDFGYCQMTGYLPKPSLQYNVGSPGFMAPESIVGNMYSQNSEVWSLGTILYEMMTGRNYTNGKPVMEAVMLIKTQGPYYPDNCSPFTKQLIKDCMMLKPEERLKVKALKKILHDNVKALPQIQRPPVIPTMIRNGFSPLTGPHNLKSQQGMLGASITNPEHQMGLHQNDTLKTMMPNPTPNGMMKNSMFKNPSGKPSFGSNVQIPSVPPSETKSVSFNDVPQVVNIPPNNPLPHIQNTFSHNNLLQNSMGYNQLLAQVNQQTNSMNQQFNRMSYPQPQVEQIQQVNPWNTPGSNVIMNLSPKRKDKELSNELNKKNQPMQAQVTQQLQIQPVPILPPTENMLKKSIENLNTSFLKQKPLDNRISLPHTQTKQPLKAIQHTTHQIPSIHTLIPLPLNPPPLSYQPRPLQQIIPGVPTAIPLTMTRSRNKNMTQSGYDNEPDSAPFYMPNLGDDDYFEEGFKMSQGISNNLLGRDLVPAKQNISEIMRSQISSERSIPLSQQKSVAPSSSRQSIQASQISSASNFVQQSQQLRNSQQFQHQKMMRNSLSKPSFVHPVPQFTPQYSNTIAPGYFGFPTGH